MINPVNEIRSIIEQQSDAVWSVADISYSPFKESYTRGIIIAQQYRSPLLNGEYNEEKYHHILIEAKIAVEDKVNRIRQLLDGYGIKNYVPPASQTDEEALRAPFSFKYAAVQGGLGWIGKNGVLVTRQYGPRVRLGAILLNYPLDCGNPVQDSACGTCTACADAYPWKLIKGRTWTISTIRDELLDYQSCNKKRSEYIGVFGRKHECGHCILACPWGIREP